MRFLWAFYLATALLVQVRTFVFTQHDLFSIVGELSTKRDWEKFAIGKAYVILLAKYCK